MIWLEDMNWQMTLLFLLALSLLFFVMKLVALLVAPSPGGERPFRFWILPSPKSLRRSLPVTNVRQVLFRAALLFGTVSLGYWIYWRLVGAFHVRGIPLSYLAAPLLLLVSESLVAAMTVLCLPGGRLFPALHERPWAARGVAEFWGRRWNLWFRDWFRDVVFVPLRRRPVLALVLVFAVSGLMHEWVINVPLCYLTRRALFGSMMIYFLLQAAGVLLERHCLKGRSTLRLGFAWAVVLGPAPLVLNEGLLRTLHLWPE
ncbi:MAG: hypothetical protein HZA90_12830 [Verrucomicrobia bacterium]|nr:hypothetical protein [Verrucomicrobiota bacterium]